MAIFLWQYKRISDPYENTLLYIADFVLQDSSFDE